MPETQYSQIEVNDTHYERGLRVLKPIEEKLIDDTTIEQFAQETQSFLTPGSSSYDSNVDYCVDLSKIESISSSALMKLINLDKKHHETRNKNLMIANVHPAIYEVFAITRLNRLFDMHKTIEDCLKEIKMPNSILTHDDSIPNVRVLGTIENKITSEEQAKRLRSDLIQYTPGGEKYDSNRELIFSFYGTEYFSSLGNGPLINAEQRLKQESKRLRIVDARREIYEVFAITDLARVFDLNPGDTLDDYVAGRL